ncbi:UbiX family flavin prenyltransferase [Desulfogranum japonicum]|uniref:UbiX family flavin prenyltransferase n=1 Tax=Desulfogranum japonicum TaxID=231447 RepID=UPI0003F7DEAA|nr:UbiX family flavin prenyltransferase [Desulfogranum japonicum]
MITAKKRILLAVTGATGMLYVPSFLKLAAENQVEVHGIISEAGKKVLQFELDKHAEELEGVNHWYACNDFTAAPASGSARFDGMVVLPCTVGTLGAIAGGVSYNLIHRAADVCLKERRTLLLAVRETPLNRIHLQNMLQLHDAGAIICPPLPTFYNRPADFAEMARNYAGRICDLMGIENLGVKRWEGSL